MQSDKQFQDYFYYHSWDRAGRAEANGREPKTGLDQVFNFKLDCPDDVHVLIYADARPRL